MNIMGGLSAALVFFIVLSAFLVLFIWSTKRHRDPDLKIECDAEIEQLLPSLAGLTLGAPLAGNSVEVCENGAAFDAMEEAIRAARTSVHFETFLWKDGVLGRRMAAAFVDRARAGVEVRVLVDANGGKEIGKEVVKQLTDAGCRFKTFHPWGIRNVGVMNERDHRKILVVDGRTAFVGGHCIVDTWLGEAQDKEHFGDVSVRLRGPIVGVIQGAFSENWAGETGELFMGEDVFPKLEREGDVTIHAAFAKPEGSAPAVKILHHSVLCVARKRIRIQNPYFIPEPDAIRAFEKAVKRGVDVRVMVPSVGGSDNPMVQHASHRNFEWLLKIGVRLFEYPHTLLHQKLMTVDGIWCAVGSSNFDDRSFEINDEITLSMCDETTARRFEEMFDRYVKDCREIKLEEWSKRSLWHKAIDNMYYALNEFM